MASKDKQPKDSKKNDPRFSSMGGFIFAVCILVAVIGSIMLEGKASSNAIGAWVVIWTLAGIYVLFGLKVAAQWEKAVVLRFGKFRALKGPGMFWIVPVMDSIPSWIDGRVMVTPFAAQKT